MKIRNYVPTDLDTFRNVYTEAGKELFNIGDVSGFFFESIMGRPNFIPTRDIFLAENKTGKVLGFSFIRFEQAIKRVIFACFVRPPHRRQNLGTELLRWSIHKARKGRAGKMHASVEDRNIKGQGFLSRVGFIPVRRHLRMKLDLSRFSEGRKAFESTQLENFLEGQESALAEIQNAIFKGSWGFCPNTEEDIKFFLKLTGSRLQDILVLFAGEKRAGYLWPHIISEEPGYVFPKQGRIHMCGIVKEFQGRGWGRSLIISGLLWFRQLGIQNIELMVDSQNVPAVALYKSLGFVTCTQELWYELSLGGT